MQSRYIKKISANIASGATKSDAINVEGFKFFAVELPSAAAGLNSGTVSVRLLGSDTSSGTFRPLEVDFSDLIVSATSGNKIITVNCLVPRWMKIELTNNTAATGGYAASVHCFY